MTIWFIKQLINIHDDHMVYQSFDKPYGLHGYQLAV